MGSKGWSWTPKSGKKGWFPEGWFLGNTENPFKPIVDRFRRFDQNWISNLSEKERFLVVKRWSKTTKNRVVLTCLHLSLEEGKLSILDIYDQNEKLCKKEVAGKTWSSFWSPFWTHFLEGLDGRTRENACWKKTQKSGKKGWFSGRARGPRFANLALFANPGFFISKSGFFA